jgi:hypothetical protein
MCIYFYCLGSVWGLGGVDSYYSFREPIWELRAGGTELGAGSWGFVMLLQ